MLRRWDIPRCAVKIFPYRHEGVFLTSGRAQHIVGMLSCRLNSVVSPVWSMAVGMRFCVVASYGDDAEPRASRLPDTHIVLRKCDDVLLVKPV